MGDDPVNGFHDELRRRLLEAEKRIRREDYIPQKPWKKVQCPNCDMKIEYREGKDWRGTLLCDKKRGGCGTRFQVPSLDKFVN